MIRTSAMKELKEHHKTRIYSVWYPRFYATHLAENTNTRSFDRNLKTMPQQSWFYNFWVFSKLKVLLLLCGFKSRTVEGTVCMISIYLTDAVSLLHTFVLTGKPLIVILLIFSNIFCMLCEFKNIFLSCHYK